MHAASNSIAGCLPALPPLPFPVHDLVCRSRSALAASISSTAVCVSLQGRFLAVDAEMRLRAAFLRFLRRMRCDVCVGGVRVSIIEIYWTEDGRVNRNVKY